TFVKGFLLRHSISLQTGQIRRSGYEIISSRKRTPEMHGSVSVRVKPRVNRPTIWTFQGDEALPRYVGGLDEQTVFLETYIAEGIPSCSRRLSVRALSISVPV